MTVTDNPKVSHWDLDGGYTGGANESPYPRRMSITKIYEGLTIMLRIRKEDIEYGCEDPISGFNLFFSTPSVTISPKRQWIRIPSMEHNFLYIKPTIWMTSNDLRDFKPNERHCIYNHERQLRFFKYYSRPSCEAECLANFTQKQCGCVKLSMPSTNL